MTDVNLLLGRLDPSKFSIPIFPEASSDRFSEIVAKVNCQSGEQLAEEAVLKGFLEIADERMGMRFAAFRLGMAIRRQNTP